jgi:hypothetical protein
MACQGRLEGQVGVVENERAVDAKLERPALLLEFPPQEAAGPHASVVDAAMARELARCSRRRMVGEIRWSADDGHSQVGTDADRDHVLLDELAEANAGIEAQGDDIAPIPGTKRVAGVEENTAADRVELSAKQLERLNDLTPAAGERHDQGNMAVIDR